jgi:phage FluMu protein Com
MCLLPSAAALSAQADCRCLCGSLLARVVEGAVELKCRRCKRTLRVPLAEEARVARPAARAVPAGEAG